MYDIRGPDARNDSGRSGQGSIRVCEKFLSRSRRFKRRVGVLSQRGGKLKRETKLLRNYVGSSKAAQGSAVFDDIFCRAHLRSLRETK